MISFALTRAWYIYMCAALYLVVPTVSINAIKVRVKSACTKLYDESILYNVLLVYI